MSCPVKFRVCTQVALIAFFFLGAGKSLSQQQPSADIAGSKAAKGRPNSEKKQATVKDGHPYLEDFSLLPIDKNSLRQDLTVLGEVDDKPGLPYIRERWHLEWRPGDPIDVYILKPRGVEKPPVIVYLYSYPQDTDRFKSDTWGGYATGDNFAAVGFVSALTGHRLEHRAPKETFFTELPESIGATVHDVQMILNYLSTRKDLDTSRIGMFGQGSGGTVAILASAVDPRIKAVDVLTPWGDWPTFIKASTFVPSEDRLKINTPEFLASVAPLDPVQWLPNVKARSLRIQNVRREGHMPDIAQEHLEAVAGATAEIDQFGDSAALVPAAANGKLLQWIKSQLQPDAKPQIATDKSQRIHFFPPKKETSTPGSEIH